MRHISHTHYVPLVAHSSSRPKQSSLSMSNTELLSPAGTLKTMRYAFAYGADAVYAGQPRYSLRVRNNEFNKLENLEAGINMAHEQGKQFYLATNLAPHNDKIRYTLALPFTITACTLCFACNRLSRYFTGKIRLSSTR